MTRSLVSRRKPKKSELSEEEKLELLSRALHRRVAQARQSPLGFFDFAWREEDTHQRVTSLALQRVLFKFIADHPLCVVRMPPGYSKTTTAIAIGLWLLGSDTSSRGAFVSATEAQAYKPVSALRDLIEYMDETFPEVRAVFPTLRRSMRPNDPWSKSLFTVDRPAGIRDASVTAYGQDSTKITGSRLGWVVVDDILSIQNTLTVESRKSMIRWFMQVLRTRLDPNDGRAVVTNTPYHRDDLTYYLELKAKFPTLSMNSFGEIRITNDDEWDCEEIRPSTCTPNTYRLVAHDSARFGAPLAVRDTSQVWAWRAPYEGEQATEHFDLKDEIPLWPEKFSLEALSKIEGSDEVSRAMFSMNYKLKIINEADAKCWPEWIENCKQLARRVGHTHTVSNWQPRPGAICFMGVDIGGLGLQEDDDWSCFFIYELLTEPVVVGSVTLRRGLRRILKVEYGRWRSKVFVDRLVFYARAYNALTRVEKNSESSLQDWADEIDSSILVTPHVTSSNKHHVVYGVESVFLAMEKGRWLIPNDDEGQMDPHVERWVQACLDYRPPPAHTDDGIMAAWFASEEERSVWKLPPPADEPKPRDPTDPLDIRVTG